MSDFWSPLYRLIEQRRNELNLSKAELAHQCGCKNADKAIRWIDAICNGSVDHPRAKEIAKYLPVALKLDREVFCQALAETIQQVEKNRLREEVEREAAWRASFKSHGYLDTESRIPSQITICALTGGPEHYLRINLELTRSPVTFARQAGVVARRTRSVLFFGTVIGFWVNYCPDRAVKYDLNENPIEIRDRAYWLGETYVRFGG